jgi:sporulation protein YlmC with PRC-barrel domain
MLVEVTSLYDLEVYTPKGLLLGRVYEILVDTRKSEIYELILGDTNPNIVDNSRSIGVPFRWVSKVSEIVVLRYFPGKIHVKTKLSRYRKIRRKLRVLRKKRAPTHGVTRQPWEPPKHRLR